jgi:hypothetical protein
MPIDPPPVRAVHVERLDIPLHEPFGISGGAQATARNVLLALELADGTVGYGEAAPLPACNGETQTAATRELVTGMKANGIAPVLLEQWLPKDDLAGARVLWSGDIGDGAVIGAGAVVVKPVPPFSVAVGVPARVVRKRAGPNPAAATSPMPPQHGGKVT